MYQIIYNYAHKKVIQDLFLDPKTFKSQHFFFLLNFRSVMKFTKKNAVKKQIIHKKSI